MANATHPIARALRALACVTLAGACTLAARAASAPEPEPMVLTVPRLGQFRTLDPVHGWDLTGDQLLRQFYGTLLTYAYLERPYKLEPDLLEAMPTLSTDRLTYTFKLRKGVRFVDNACFPGGKGRELVADDVLYSLKRYADGNINAESWFAMQGAVVGFDDYHAATLKAGPGSDLTGNDVAGLRKIDNATFTITLTHPNSLFLNALTMSPTSVVAREAVQFYKDRFGVNPVGTGPFIATGEVPRNGTVRLVRNPAYYRTYPSVGAPGDVEKGLLKDAGKRLPIADVLELPLIEEAQPAALRFLRGDIDWRPLDRAWFTKMVVRKADGDFRLADEYAGKFRIYGEPGMEIEYLLFNLHDPVVGNNKLLRQAIAAAIDPQAVVDVLFNGRGRTLQSFVPIDFPGSERDTGAVGRRHDVAAARELLAQAGFPSGRGLPPLSITFFETNTSTRTEFDLYKKQLAAIGVQAKGVFMADQPTFTKAAENGNFQIASYGWAADYPDAENFYQLNYGRNVPPGSNWSRYASPAYDKAYETSRFMANGPERLAEFRTMNALIRDDVPEIVLFAPMKFGITQNWIGNFKRNLLVQELMFMSADMALRKKGL